MQPEFLWGAATSSHQIDGDNINSDWWQWEATGVIEGGKGSGKATDHWNRCVEDLEIAKSLGLNTYRFSIEWARIEPKEGLIDESALAWYENLLSHCERLKLVPMATLHHFTNPKWLADRGGFAWAHSPKSFERFTKLIVKTLGGRVPLWCILNEPNNLTIGQYLAGYMPPAKFSPDDFASASQNMLKAHVLAYDVIHHEITRRTGPFRQHPVMVGIAHNMIDFVAANHWNPMERLLVQVLRRFYNRAWLDAVTGEKQHFGVTGLVPYAEQVPMALGRKTVDFIGINYYTKAYICWKNPGEKAEDSGYVPMTVETTKEKSVESFLPFQVCLMKKGEVASDMGWAVHPDGLGGMIRFVKTYNLPIYITENGIADGDDSRRADYLKSHLLQIAHEIEHGTDIRGFYYWSLLDNFEWIKGFGPRFGLVHVDYETFSRKIRSSAKYYAQIVRAHTSKHRPPSISLIKP